MKSNTLILVLCLLGLTLPVIADTVVLKNQTILEGSVVYSDSDWIKLRQGSNKILLISREDVFSLKRDKGSDGYIRYTKIRDGRSALEVASKTFANPQKTKFISLVGAVHIGDMDYYARLQKILDDHDVVLFEGVGSTSTEDLTQWKPPSKFEKEQELAGERHIQQHYQRSKASSNLDFLTQLQTSAGQYLNLAFQKDGLNYARSWWKPADVSMEELQQLMESKGASFFDFLAMSQNQDMEEQVNQILAKALQNLATLLMGKPLEIIAKETLGELLAMQMDAMDPTSSHKDETSNTPKIMQVLIVCRNDKVMQCTRDVLKVPEIQTIAVFYGAGHNPDLEKRIVSELGFQLYKEEWLIGWDIKDPSKPLREKGE